MENIVTEEKKVVGHTPGPWHVHIGGDYGECGVAHKSVWSRDYKTLVAEIRTQYPDKPFVRSEIEDLANADLIAAAPELFAKLEWAMETIIWMSGADAFGPSGLAHEVWVRKRDEMDDAFSILKRAQGGAQ